MLRAGIVAYVRSRRDALCVWSESTAGEEWVEGGAMPTAGAIPIMVITGAFVGLLWAVFLTAAQIFGNPEWVKLLFALSIIFTLIFAGLLSLAVPAIMPIVRSWARGKCRNFRTRWNMFACKLGY